MAVLTMASQIQRVRSSVCAFLFTAVVPGVVRFLSHFSCPFWKKRGEKFLPLIVDKIEKGDPQDSGTRS